MFCMILETCTQMTLNSMSKFYSQLISPQTSPKSTLTWNWDNIRNMDETTQTLIWYKNVEKGTAQLTNLDRNKTAFQSSLNIYITIIEDRDELVIYERPRQDTGKVIPRTVWIILTELKLVLILHHSYNWELLKGENRKKLAVLEDELGRNDQLTHRTVD